MSNGDGPPLLPACLAARLLAYPNPAPTPTPAPNPNPAPAPAPNPNPNPQGVGSVNVRPANLRAPCSVQAVLDAWRLIPNRSQEPRVALRVADLHAAVAAGELHNG